MLRVGNINKRRGPGVISLLLIFHVNWPKESDSLWGRKRRDTSDESGDSKDMPPRGFLGVSFAMEHEWRYLGIPIKNIV